MLAAVLVFAGAATLIVVGYRRLQIAESKAERLDHYCVVVRNAMRQDWRDLEDPNRRDQGAIRFLGTTSYHSRDEIMMCAAGPLDLSTPCRPYDYACLAERAHLAERAIPGP